VRGPASRDLFEEINGFIDREKILHLLSLQVEQWQKLLLLRFL
jgi:hypothetical protein